MNKVILKGRIGQDIKAQGEGDKRFCGFSVAISEGTKDKPFTTWINCTAFAHTADFISKYFQKGQEILVEGRLSVRSVEKDGQNKTYTSVIVERRQG